MVRKSPRVFLGTKRRLVEKRVVEFRSRLKHHHLLAEGADGGALSPMGVAGALLSKFVDVDGVILV